MTPMTNLAINSQPTTTSTSIYPAKTSDILSDGQSLPPFLRADELDAAVSELDQWVSTFIGRMTPYCHDAPLEVTAGRAGAIREQDARPISPYEHRLIATRESVFQILDALDNMNQRLNL